MPVRVGINGFGRIGRNILRAIIESGRKDIEVVAINDLTPLDNAAYLFRFDSVHGRYDGEVSVTESSIDVGTGQIPFSANRDPSALDWGNVDIALECTGFFKDRDKADLYLQNGSRRVLVSAPAKGADKTIVFGVNQDALTSGDVVVSNASCTTNCLSPVAKTLNDRFEITEGLLTTIHSYTGSQPTLDRGNRKFARGRAAAVSMVPTTTGAAKAVAKVLPELEGRLDGVAIRVPTPNVSCVDFKFNAAQPITVQSVNTALTEAAKGRMKGILTTEDQPLVSIDMNHNPHSAIVALDQTQVQNNRMGRVMIWYDNEWGFSNRMADTAVAMGKFL
ncbi:MAG: type I glyceraldehyde-3-phosphate dehydrogenase [Rhodobacteraceae bacterium]|nr:type I glyceraldehyde-3-phosphate dehydrogenase [Paracoccaceae bacterium]